jgi:type II secretory pathway component PulC
MTLAFLRQNPMAGFDSGSTSDSAGKRSAKKKLPKGKFSLLLSGNLIVWVIFAVSFMDIKVFSMNAKSLPKIPQKLAISGIVYNEKSPSAIISKQVYGVGDVVDGYTISRITRTEVEFEKNGKKLIRQTR